MSIVACYRKLNYTRKESLILSINLSNLSIVNPLQETPIIMASSMTERQGFWLKVAHWVAGIGHVGSAIAIVAASGGSSWSPALELSNEFWQETPCTINKSLDTTEECFVQSRVIDTFSYSIVWVCFLFAAWSGLLHFVTLWFWKRVYLEDLKRGVSRFRWYDYLLSSSLMITAIAVFAGIVDVWAILCIALLQAVVILMGQISERMISRPKQIMWFSIASIFYLAGVWLPLLITFVKSVGNIPEERENLPMILISGFSAFFFVYSSFASVSAYNIYTRFKRYLACEFAYIILSLVSKTLLHWVLFYSLLNRAENLSNEVYEPTQSSNIASDAVYAVIGITVGGGILLAIFFAIMWNLKRQSPELLSVDRKRFAMEMIERIKKAAQEVPTNEIEMVSMAKASESVKLLSKYHMH
jgi:hypothetical protein